MGAGASLDEKSCFSKNARESKCFTTILGSFRDVSVDSSLRRCGQFGVQR